MSDIDDKRPPVAIGHIFANVADVPAATEFFVKAGVRPIVTNEKMAVLELRGGTHIVVRAQEPVEAGAHLPFDFMVDDVDATHREFHDRGLTVSAITRGRIHDGFDVTAPDGQLLKINSSHAGNRPV